MTIESQNQILTPYDRLSRRLDNLFKMENQTPAPDTFDAYIFVDHITEEAARTARSEVDSTTEPVTGFLKCRVFDENFHHAGQMSPIDAKTVGEYQLAINGCSEGYVRADHPNLGSLVNGSIWTCSMKGQTIQLLSLSQASAFTFNPQSGQVEGKPDGAKESLNNGTKIPVGDRPSGTMVEIKFKNNRASLINQAKKNPYKDFLPELSKKLTELGFSASIVVVTSLFRGPVAQVAAMMGGRIEQGSSASYNGFVEWLEGNYKGSLGNEVRAIVKEKDWSSDVEGLRTKLIAKVTEQYNAGKYLSNHMVGGAIDLRTNDVAWSDVQIMLESLKQLKTSGFVKFYQLENSRTSPTATPPSAEHIHFALATNGASE